MSIAPKQSRAGRALLDWTLDRLAQESGLAKGTLVKFENGGSISAGLVKALQATFETHGVCFLGDAGVTLGPPQAAMLLDLEQIRPRLIDIITKVVGEVIAARGDAPPLVVKDLAAAASSRVLSDIPADLLADRQKLAAYLDRAGSSTPAPSAKPMIKINRPE